MLADYILTKLDQTEWRRAKSLGNTWQGGALTVSTSFWGLVYDVTAETGLFKIKLEQVLPQLQRENLIEINNQGLVRLTDNGVRARNEYANFHYVPQGLTLNLYYDLKALLPVFLLANQAISELAYQNKKYYPYQIDLRNQWKIKHWLTRHSRQKLINDWYTNLKDYLMTINNTDAELFTSMLFGHNIANKLFNDLVFPAAWDEFDWYLWQLDHLAQLVAYSREHQTIVLDLANMFKRSLLSSSAQISVELLNEGLSVEQIAKRRNVKVATIREHILNAVILQNWSQSRILKLIPQIEVNKMVAIFNNKKVVDWQYDAYHSNDNPIYFTYFRLYQIVKLQEEKDNG